MATKAFQKTARKMTRFKTVTVKGKRYLLVPASEYRRMQSAPGASPGGAIDALAFADATIAKSIVRDRQSVGLTQRELADRAGIRVEVLNRAERGVVVPSVRTLTKIENALMAAGLKRRTWR
jgi:ribosome-binding protein aMBF1 (putative translation factor)